MAARFELDFVTFYCKHSKCGEIFEKSLSGLAVVPDVFCPRCGTAARTGDENQILAAARTSEEGAYMDKTAR